MKVLETGRRYNPLMTTISYAHHHDIKRQISDLRAEYIKVSLA